MDWQNEESRDCVHHGSIHIRLNDDDYDAGNDYGEDVDFLINILHVLLINHDDWHF